MGRQINLNKIITLAHNSGTLAVVTRISDYPIVRTLQNTLLIASAVQVININGPYSLSVVCS